MSWNRRANASPAQKPRARASQRMSVATPFEERDVDAVLEVVVDGVLDARPDRDAGDVSVLADLIGEHVGDVLLGPRLLAGHGSERLLVDQEGGNEHLLGHGQVPLASFISLIRLAALRASASKSTRSRSSIAPACSRMTASTRARLRSGMRRVRRAACSLMA